MTTITIDQAQYLGACQSGIARVIAYLGRTPAPNEAIPLTVVLDASPRDLDDVCWAVAHINRPVLVQWATDCAEAAALVAEPVSTSPEARAALDAARALNAALRAGADETEQRRRADDAYAAAYATYAAANAAADAAYAAADAANAAADAAAYAAACAADAAADAAAYAAADAAKMQIWCRERLRAYLEGRDPGLVLTPGKAPTAP